MRRSLLSLLSVAWLACVMSPASVAAQSPWLVPRSDQAVHLEILKPSFDDGPDFTFTTLALFLSGRLAVGENVVLVAEVPFANVGVGDGFEESESAVGNIYLGAEFRGTDSPVFGEFGVRLPTTKDADYFDDLFMLMDVVDRWEAFLHEIVSLHAGFNYRYSGPTGLDVGFRIAPVLWIDVGDALVDPVELFALYGAHVGYDAANLALRGGFSGRALITEGDADLGERTLHQFVLAASYGLGRWWPGVQIHLPLDDDLTEVLDLVFGLSLTVQLP
ncbi:MAG: hypothetical protein AMS25_04050 [Gemmatimonas sp. SM23_52]|nr:MAG: hypothetical protein AMS25_04050 [Gemmatimonas sp. SM23_52]